MNQTHRNSAATDSDQTGSGRLVSESVLLSALTGFIGKVTGHARTSMTAGLLDSYPEAELSDNDGVAAGLIERSRVRSRVLMPFFRVCNRAFAASPLLAAFRAFGRLLLDLPVSFFGTIFFSFGLFHALIGLLTRSLLNTGASLAETVGFGAAVMLCSVVLFLSQTPLGEALGEGKITGFFLTDVFGFRRELLTRKKERKPRAVPALLTGLLLALASLRVSAVSILLLPLTVGCGAMILLSPEAGILLLFGLFPFLTTMRTAGLLIFTFFSFFCKLIQGKRTLKFEALDIVVVGFLLTVFLGGFVSVSKELSIRPALMYTALLSGYFLTVNLIRTRRQIGCAIGITAASAAVISCLGILEYLLGSAKPEWLDLSLFPDIVGRVTSTFANPNVLGEYLVMVIPLLMIPLLTGKSAGTKLFGIALTGLGIVCLVFTWSRGAWLGFLVGMILLLLLSGTKTIAALLGVLLVSPLLFSFLPASVTGRFLSIGSLTDTSTNYRVGIWRSSLSMLEDWWYSGIGTGCPLFESVFPIYSGRIEAEHAHSLFLELFIEHGILGLLLFLGILFFAAKSFFSYLRKKTDPGEEGLKTASVVTFVGTVSFLVQGLTDYSWYNYRIFCFFWMLLALTAACRRTAASERTEIGYDGTYLNIPYRKETEKQ